MSPDPFAGHEPPRTERRIAVVSPEGIAGTVPESSLEDALARGFRLESVQETRDRSDRAKYGGTEGKIDAFIGGAIRGASLGTLAPLDPNARAYERAVRNVNPGSALAGELTGAIAPGLASGGSGVIGQAARLSPAGMVPGAGRAAASSAKGALLESGVSSPLVRALAGTGQGAVEGAIFGAGQGIGELQLDEGPLTAERIAGTLGSNVLLGGTLGGGLGLAGTALEGLPGLVRKGADAVRNRTSAVRAGEAVQAADDAAIRSGALVADLDGMDRAALRTARKTEVVRIEAEKAAEREAIAGELKALREAGQESRWWAAAPKSEEAAIAFKADKQIRNLLDNPKALASNPYKTRMARDALQQQETGLEKFLANADTLETRGAAQNAAILRSIDDAVDIQLAKGRKLADGLEERLQTLRARGPRPEDEKLLARYEADTNAATSQASKELAETLRGERVHLTAEESAWFTGLAGTRVSSATLDDVSLLRSALDIRTVALPGIKIGGDAAKAYAALAGTNLSRTGEALIKTADLKTLRNAVTSGELVGREAKAIESARALLDRNRRIQSRIENALAAPASPRLSAIEARLDDAYAGKGPKTFAGHLVEKGAFTGAMTLAGALGAPHVVAGMLAARVADAVGDATLANLKGALSRATDRAGSVLSKSLDAITDVSKTTARTMPRAAPIVASKILGSASFAPAHAIPAAARPSVPTSNPRLAALRDRDRELRAQIAPGANGRPTLRPEARADLRERLAGVRAVAPALAANLETIAARRLEFLASKLPTPPRMLGLAIGPDRWQPSDLQIGEFARYVDAAEHPEHVLGRLQDGTVTHEDREAMIAVYPEMYEQIRLGLAERLANLQATLPYQRRLSLGIFFGLPIDPALEPRVRDHLQGNFATEPGTNSGTRAPAVTPRFGPFGSLPKRGGSLTDLTTAQRLAHT